MADFTWRASFGAQMQKRPKLFKAEFGDGYTQRAGKGINFNPDSWNLSFDSVDDVTADEIMNFLDAKGGVTSFSWVNLNGVTGLYTCESYDRTFDDEDKNTIKAVFNRVYGG
jgi:phage-related protein